MIPFLKNEVLRSHGHAERLELGSLEFELMEIVWSRGDSNVRDVVGKVEKPLAYTTVMTTLDRLYKKGLLNREKVERAYVYSPRMSRKEWERRRAGNMIAGFLAGPHPSRELLVSCLLDAVGEHDAAVLDKLEKEIRKKRKELFRRGQP
jgi:predicted transcriptional regulator